MYLSGTQDDGDASSKEYAEPLLKKSEAVNEGESNQPQPSAPMPPYHPGYGYVYEPRPYRDVTFTVIFVLLVLASAAFGIFSIVNHNSEYDLADSALYNSSSRTCYTSAQYGSIVLKSRNAALIGAISNVKSSGIMPWMSLQKGLRKSLYEDSFSIILVWALVVTIVLCVPFIVGFLWLLKAFAKQLVYACLPFFILIPVFLNVFWFVACILSSECQEAFSLAGRIALFIFIFVLCGIFAWIIYSNWDRVELTIKIMQTAAVSLMVNWALLLVLPALSFLLIIYLVPFGVFLYYAYMNGDIVATSGTDCVGESASGCCSWKVDSWVPAYYVLALLTVLWSILLLAEAQVYILSSTVAQWYFAMQGSRVGGSIRHALWAAFGPSFGTVCFSGLVLSFVRMIRAAIDSSVNSAQQGCLMVLIRCCIRFVLFAVEFINKFTINFAAITGEAYCNSARLSYDLLKRNLLSPVLVEVISTRLLGGMAFVLSIIYAIVVCAILRASTDLGGAVYYVALIVWAFLFVVMLLFSQVLDNIIDTIYVCYAIDKDSGAVSNSDVHNVYIMLPMSRDQAPTLAVPQP